MAVDSPAGDDAALDVVEVVERLRARVEVALGELMAVKEELGQLAEAAEPRQKEKVKRQKFEEGTSNIEQPTLNVEEKDVAEEEGDGGGAVGLAGMTPVECERVVGEVVGDVAEEVEEPGEARSVPGVASGRVRVMTGEVRRQVCCYLQAGLSRRQAAAFVGCHHTAITKAAQRDEQFAAELEQAERISEALPLMRVVKASRKSWRAAAWLAKHHHPHAWLRRERSEEQDRETAASLSAACGGDQSGKGKAESGRGEEKSQEPVFRDFNELVMDRVQARPKFTDFLRWKVERQKEKDASEGTADDAD